VLSLTLIPRVCAIQTKSLIKEASELEKESKIMDYFYKYERWAKEVGAEKHRYGNAFGIQDLSFGKGPME